MAVTERVKPVVKLRRAELLPSPQDGYFLLGTVEGHPYVEDGHRVRTSKVLRVETLNTVYELED